MKKHWWKLLTIALMLYTLGFGMLIPLGAGIQSISPVVVDTSGQITFTLSTYYANYQQDVANQKLKVRLRLNKEQALCATAVQAPDAQTLLVTFDIPQGRLPVDTAPPARNKKPPFPLLEVSGADNGYTSLQSAVFFRNSSTKAASSDKFCTLETYPPANSMTFPFLPILEETIRNLYYHVPMWFGMMIILFISMIYSILYLYNLQNIRNDNIATAFAMVGVLYGILGLVTGMLWAKNTWGAYWSWDVKQNTSAVAMLIYLAYFVLRSSFDDQDKKARISAIYNIFAFATLIPLLYVVPRMVDSLHPGMGGNPAFSSYDLDSTMRLVFYPSILAWTLLGVWMATLQIRYQALNEKIMNDEGQTMDSLPKH